MVAPTPLTVRARPRFQLFLWALTLLYLVVGGALLTRAIAWIPLMRQEPTLVTLFLPVLFFLALAAWIGRWALFHSTVRVAVDEEGLRMQSAVASDALRWSEVEGIRLQMTSGSEAQLVGRGHRVTVPSGSAPTAEANEKLQAWITYRLGERELAYGDVHFWGP